MTHPAPAMPQEEQRAILTRIRDDLTRLCQCQDALLEGQYAFLRERVEALLALTEV